MVIGAVINNIDDFISHAHILLLSPLPFLGWLIVGESTLSNGPIMQSVAFSSLSGIMAIAFTYLMEYTPIKLRPTMANLFTFAIVMSSILVPCEYPYITFIYF